MKALVLLTEIKEAEHRWRWEASRSFVTKGNWWNPKWIQVRPFSWNLSRQIIGRQAISLPQFPPHYSLIRRACPSKLTFPHLEKEGNITDTPPRLWLWERREHTCCLGHSRPLVNVHSLFPHPSRNSGMRGWHTENQLHLKGECEKPTITNKQHHHLQSWVI